MRIISSPPGPPLPVSIANGGTNSGTSLNNNRIMVSSGGTIIEAGAMTNGQLLIGSTGAAPVVAALTAGSNITITNAAGAITVAASSGAATPVYRASTSFETAARFTSTTVGTGTVTYGANGAVLSTGANATSSQTTYYNVFAGANGDVLPGSPFFSSHFWKSTTGTDYNIGLWIGDMTIGGSSLTLTTLHAGFKVTRATSGTENYYATQADATTETASASLGTLATTAELDIIAKINSTTSVDYYNRKNGGALSAATNLTGNMPTSLTARFHMGVTNIGVADTTAITVPNFSYERG